ncbi:MAG: hypothetical protein AAGB31_15745 [Bdellovibrio sp.]
MKKIVAGLLILASSNALAASKQYECTQKFLSRVFAKNIGSIGLEGDIQKLQISGIYVNGERRGFEQKKVYQGDTSTWIGLLTADGQDYQYAFVVAPEENSSQVNVDVYDVWPAYGDGNGTYNQSDSPISKYKCTVK